MGLRFKGLPGLTDDHQTWLLAPHRRLVPVDGVARCLCGRHRADAPDACEAISIDATALAWRPQAARRRACRYPCLPSLDDARADRFARWTGKRSAAGPDPAPGRLCRWNAHGDGGRFCV